MAYVTNRLQKDERWQRHLLGDCITLCQEVGQGWGLLSQFPSLRYFPNLSSLSKHTLPVKYRVYIWQVSPQLSCGDTCQIWMWFEESTCIFARSKILLTEKLTNGALVTPTPGSLESRYSTAAVSQHEASRVSSDQSGAVFTQNRTPLTMDK